MIVRIGELAERSGLTTKALRYYEQVGVLDEPARTSSGYRNYDEGALGRLEFIRAGQAVGLTLGEIREVIAFRERGEAPCEHVLDLIRTRRSELDDQIERLESIRTELDRLVERAQQLDREQCPADTVCHLVVPSRAS